MKVRLITSKYKCAHYKIRHVIVGPIIKIKNQQFHTCILEGATGMSWLLERTKISNWKNCFGALHDRLTKEQQNASMQGSFSNLRANPHNNPKFT